MPKTLEVITCAECKHKAWCWSDERPPAEPDDPRGGVCEEEIDDWYCGAALPKEAGE